MPAAITWQGGDPTEPYDWRTGANWVGNVAPGANDTAIINQAAKAPQIYVGTTVGAITLQNGGTLNVTRTGSLTVTGSVNLGTGCTLIMANNVTANSVRDSGTLSIYNSSTLTAGVTIVAGGTLQLDNSHSFITGNVSNAGNLSLGSFQGGSPGDLDIYGTYSQTGTMTIWGSGNFLYSLLSVTGTATLGGTLATASDGTANPTMDKSPIGFLNAGSVVNSFTNDTVTWGNLDWTITYSATAAQLAVKLRTENPSDPTTPLAWYEDDSTSSVAGVDLGGGYGPVLIADFIDSPYINLNDPNYGVTITVDWGDGSGSQVVQADSDGDVWADHTYAAAGSYTMTITVTDIATGANLDSVYDQTSMYVYA